MKSMFSSAILTALLFSTFAMPVRAQEQAVKQALAGQRLLVTYREGGALYGTYYFLDVHFCASGSYMTFGQSRKTTVLDNTQVGNFSERGRWDVASLNGRTLLRSQSASGQVRAYPIALRSNGIWLGDGISVVPKGAALCN
jgi:hypothetical protein